MADALIEAIRGGNLAAVRTAGKANPEAVRHPKYMLAAGQLGSALALEYGGGAGRAPSRGNARVMQAVLDASGDLGRRDEQGRTPVDIARLADPDKPAAVMAAGG
jgi:hypothetical protein